jgi:hypothetical protein
VIYRRREGHEAKARGQARTDQRSTQVPAMDVTHSFWTTFLRGAVLRA